MEKNKFLKKYQIFILSAIQILYIVSILEYAGKERSVSSLSEFLIIVFIFIGIYLYIVKKFWNIKIYLIYKIFAILNGIYIFNILLSLFMTVIKPKRYFSKWSAFIHLIFFIINLILILAYNRNVRAIENKDNLDR